MGHVPLGGEMMPVTPDMHFVQGASSNVQENYWSKFRTKVHRYLLLKLGKFRGQVILR